MAAEHQRVEPEPPARAVCLDFTNTVNWHAPGGRGRPDNWDRFTSYARLVGWAQERGLLAPAEARHLLARARREPAAAAAALAHAVGVREALYRIFSATSHGGTPHTADVAMLNEALSRALAHLRLAPARRGFDWIWASTDADAGAQTGVGGSGDATGAAGAALDRMLWPVARSAAALLTSDALQRVRECANDPCGWLFYDVTRNRSRRWCSMEGCGNRAKAHRHYARRRAAAPAPDSPTAASSAAVPAPGASLRRVARSGATARPVGHVGYSERASE